MKKILILAVLVCGNVLAGERVILKDSKELNVDVSSKTVQCSSLGYSMSELKINIAELNGWTLLDHTNYRVGGTKLPCMTAGACQGALPEGGFSPDDIIQGHPGIQKITVNRELSEVRTLDVKNDICYSSIVEKLHTVISGVEFNHRRESVLNHLPTSACVF